MTRIIYMIACMAVLIQAAVQAVQAQQDSPVSAYQKVSGISGSASSIGSDTMNNLMTLWLEGFRRYYPNVTIQVEGKGSSTAPPALIEGTAQLGPMSRPMKASEIDKFEKHFGYPPTLLRTSLDALAIFVNKDNPRRDAAIIRKILRDGGSWIWEAIGRMPHSAFTVAILRRALMDSSKITHCLRAISKMK